MAGCKSQNTCTENSSEKPALDTDRNLPLLFCWFVEDDGTGRSGYILFDARISRPLLPTERLLPSVEKVRQTLKDQGLVAPVIVPWHPEWVPEGWKVRDLTKTEAERLRFSD